MSELLPFSRLTMGVEELAAVKEVLRSGWFTAGPKNQVLEQAFYQLTGDRHAVTVSSATARVHAVLVALEIGKDDKVIIPSLTRVLTLNTICLLDATPVVVDVECGTLMVTPETIESAVTSRAKATISVHYTDAPADIDAIRAIDRRYSITAIGDAAHAAGTHRKGRHVSTKDTAIFSFRTTKDTTCAEGGLIVTDSGNLARQLWVLRFHGLGVNVYDRQTWDRAPQAKVSTPGYRYNLTDTSAAITLTQLVKLEHLNTRWREIAQQYQQALAALPLQPLNLPA